MVKIIRGRPARVYYVVQVSTTFFSSGRLRYDVPERNIINIISVYLYTTSSLVRSRQEPRSYVAALWHLFVAVDCM